MPIKNRDYVLGGIKISKKKDSSPWSAEELGVIQTISEQLSVAVESARLFEETQRKAERERTVGEIAASISAASEVEKVLQTTVEELGQRIGSAKNIKIFMSETNLAEDSDKEE
jgi:GAF domain-containing protein